MKIDSSRIHPELRGPLDAIQDNFIDIDNIEESRREVAGFATFVPLETVVIEDRMIPGVDGEPDVPVVIVTPIERRAELIPGILYIHGGGYTCGSAKENSIQVYADQINCVVVSVEYRRAPESVFPAALNDCYSALVWFHENAEQLGVDSSRIAVTGSSAGGGLTAALALYARDKKGPPIFLQAPLCPMIDDRCVTESSKNITDSRVFDRQKTVDGWRAYLGDIDAEPSMYAAPSRATDLSGLPPMYISTGEMDVFLDETLEYVALAAKSGVPVELHIYRGCYHGWEFFAPKSDISRRSKRNTIEALKDALWS